MKRRAGSSGRLSRGFGAAAVAVALVWPLGCSGGGDGEGIPVDEADLSGVSVAVGSKDFDEQLILGHIIAEAFEAAGAETDSRIALGGTGVVRDALRAGEIDTYVEYNGVAWTEHLGRDDPASDGKRLTEDVRELDLKDNEIVWLGRAPLNNALGFVAGPTLVEKNGEAFDVDSMAAHLEEDPKATLCMTGNFSVRADGLALWEDATGYEVPDAQRRILDPGLIFTETESGACSFGEVYSTDGRIPALDLTLVEDPGVMVIHNPSVTIRKDVYDEAPEAFDAIAETVLAPLDTPTMAELNRKVAVDGEAPAQIAREYLAELGLTDG